MNKDVKIRINGTHNSESDSTDIMIDAVGNYYYKNGKHYICYEIVDKETDEKYKSVIKIQNNNIEIIKRGSGAMHLLFENGKLYNTYYKTIMGNLYIGVDTKKIKIVEQKDEIYVEIEYAILVEEEIISESCISIKVCN